MTSSRMFYADLSVHSRMPLPQRDPASSMVTVPLSISSNDGFAAFPVIIRPSYPASLRAGGKYPPQEDSASPPVRGERAVAFILLAPESLMPVSGPFISMKSASGDRASAAKSARSQNIFAARPLPPIKRRYVSSGRVNDFTVFTVRSDQSDLSRIAMHGIHPAVSILNDIS